jgi:microcystin degradation protein MlrC
MVRVAIAAFMQESNSFAPRPATLEVFEAAGIARGEAIVERFAGTNSELGGFLAALEEASAEPVPLLAAHAISGGPLTRHTYETLLGELLQRLRAAQARAPLDGVLLALHGAMLAKGDDDADGTTLARVREAIGPAVPLVASLDLHANVTARMVRHATALAGYNTYPHVDQAATGRRAVHLLLAAQRGAPVHLARCSVPMVVPAETMQTTHGPLAEVYALAHRTVEEGRVADVSVFAVQPWLDVPEMGCAVVAAGADGSQVGEVVRALAGELWRRRHQFAVHLVPVDEAVEQALAAGGHPVVLADSADSPSSGSAGDSTVLLAALVRRGLHRQEEGRPCLGLVVDPESAAMAMRAGAGAMVEVAIGGKLDPRWSRPVPLQARVAWAGDGRFTFKGPSFTGTEARLGATAVLAAGRLRVVVMEHAVSTIDPELYRSVGLEPAEAQVVVVKSPNMFRAAYAPIAHQIIMVDTPGASAANLRALPFRRLPRPLYPFDDFEWQPPREVT